MWNSLGQHYPEYGMEAAGLGVFMISAALCTILLEHPSSPLHESIGNPITRRLLIGIAMGLTAIGIIYSPWGKRSGAHLNPAVTLTFFRLGKVHAVDAVFYVLAQFIGGVAGVMVVAAVLGMQVADRSVNYVATVPGPGGPAVAFLAELAISFVLMLVVLIVSNARHLARYTGLVGRFSSWRPISRWRPISASVSAIGSGLGAVLFLGTLSFMLSTPPV